MWTCGREHKDRRRLPSLSSLLWRRKHLAVSHKDFDWTEVSTRPNHILPLESDGQRQRHYVHATPRRRYGSSVARLVRRPLYYLQATGLYIYPSRPP